MFREVLRRLFDFKDGTKEIKELQKANDVLKVGITLFHRVVLQGVDLLSQRSKGVANVSTKVRTAILTMKKQKNTKLMVYEWSDMARRVLDRNNFSHPFVGVKLVERSHALSFYQHMIGKEFFQETPTVRLLGLLQLQIEDFNNTKEEKTKERIISRFSSLFKDKEVEVSHMSMYYDVTSLRQL